jgi:hypothetical protein
MVSVSSSPSERVSDLACLRCNPTVGRGSLAAVGLSSRPQTKPSRLRVRFFGCTREQIDVNLRRTAGNGTYQHKPLLENRTLGVLTESDRELPVPAFDTPQRRVRMKHDHYIYIVKNKVQFEGKERRVSRRRNWKLANTGVDENFNLALAPVASSCGCLPLFLPRLLPGLLPRFLPRIPKEGFS